MPLKWNAVLSLAMGVVGLIIAEFLPAGILTVLAQDLHISKGMAGQAVTATSVSAMITSLLIAYVSRQYNRKSVLLFLSFLLTLSNVIVALAPCFFMLILGRVILGIAIGGFWSMAAAISTRLVSKAEIPKALGLIFGGASFAFVFAAPLGSYLGNIIGWRNTFLIAAFVAFIACIWQLLALPSLAPNKTTTFRTTLDVIKIPQFSTALLAVIFVFCGRFASITYLRPFLEETAHLSVDWVSMSLLMFGLANFIGNFFAAGMIKRNIKYALIAPALAEAAISCALILWGHYLYATLILVFLWGACFAPISPAWSTWMTTTVPREAETAGGLYMAAIQFSAAIGALVGGFMFDASGSTGVFMFSGLTWALAALVVYLKI